MISSLKIALIIAMILAIGFGPTLGKDHVPLETEIEKVPTEIYTIKQSDGPLTITYKSSGPLITSFRFGCGPTGNAWLGDIDPRSNCFDIGLDGKAGVMDLAIPRSLIKETQTGELGEVQYWFYKELPFQHLNHGDSLDWIRIDIPKQVTYIKIIGHSGSPLDDHIVFSFFFGAGIFIGVLIAYAAILKMIKKIRLYI